MIILHSELAYTHYLLRVRYAIVWYMKRDRDMDMDGKWREKEGKGGKEGKENGA